MIKNIGRTKQDIEILNDFISKEASFYEGNEDFTGEYLKNENYDLLVEIVNSYLESKHLPLNSVDISTKKIKFIISNEDIINLLKKELENEDIDDLEKNNVFKIVGNNLEAIKYKLEMDVSEELLLEDSPTLKYLESRIDKEGLLDPQKLKLKLIDDYQDELDGISKEVFKSQGFPPYVNIYTDGVEWDVTYIKPKNISALLSDMLEEIEDREYSVTEFLGYYMYDFIFEKLEQYLIINIDVYTDAEDWIKENQ